MFGTCPLIHNQLICLVTIGILNLLSLFVPNGPEKPQRGGVTLRCHSAFAQPSLPQALKPFVSGVLHPPRAATRDCFLFCFVFFERLTFFFPVLHRCKVIYELDFMSHARYITSLYLPIHSQLFFSNSVCVL